LAKINLKEEKSDEIHALHKRISLELAQAYVRAVANRKESSLAPNMMSNYKLIFETPDSEIPKAKKKEYVAAILKLLEETLPTKTRGLERFEISGFITHFKGIEKTLA
jgi:hypothetical protein